MSPLYLVRLESSTIRTGFNSNAMRCPWCDGGASKEHNFYITKDSTGLIKYICHRASCGMKGKLLDNADIDSRAYVAGEFVPNVYIGATKDLSVKQREYLHSKYCFSQEDIEFGRITTTPNESQLVIPVFSPNRSVRGHITREEMEGGRKRVLSWKLLNEPWQSWYMWGSPTNILLVVEDQLSAIRVCRYVNSVALLGTLLSKEKLEEIIKYYVKPSAKEPKVVICLDKDATAKGIKYLKDYKHLLNLSCSFLSKDIKNMTEEECHTFLMEIIAQKY